MRLALTKFRLSDEVDIGCDSLGSDTKEGCLPPTRTRQQGNSKTVSWAYIMLEKLLENLMIEASTRLQMAVSEADWSTRSSQISWLNPPDLFNILDTNQKLDGLLSDAVCSSQMFGAWTLTNFRSLDFRLYLEVQVSPLGIMSLSMFLTVPPTGLKRNAHASVHRSLHGDLFSSLSLPRRLPNQLAGMW